MESDSLLNTLENTDRSQQKKLLKSSTIPSGFSEKYFLRIAQLLGQNPVLAKKLAQVWHLVDEFGDNRAFAWRAKAVLERMQGQWDKSARSFIRAGQLANSEVDRWNFQVGAIDSFARAGKTTEAVRLGRTIGTALAKLDQQALAGRAWLNTGNAYLWADEHKSARQSFERAVGHLEGSNFEIEYASAQLGLSTSALYVDLPSRALSFAERAVDEMTRLGATSYADHAEVNRGQCYLLMGEADRAVREFAALQEKSEPDSLEYARLGQFLGDAWLALQVHVAAQDAFQSALQAKGIGQSPLNKANCLVGLGEVFLGQGKVAEALKQFRKAEKEYGRFGNDALVSLARIGIAKAESRLGHHNRAKSLLQVVVQDLRSRKMHQFLVDSLLDLAELSKPIEAIPLLRESEFLIRKFGYIDDAWRLHSQRAALESTEKGKTKQYRKMVDAILVHRSRLSSVTGRTSLLEPCLHSIREYLGILVASKSKSAQEEAFRVVSALRSVTILDEYLASQQNQIPESVKAVLEEIRTEIASEGNQLPGGPLRRSSQVLRTQPRVLRAYLESIGIQKVQPSLPQVASAKQENNIVQTFVFLNDGAAWIRSDSSSQINLTKSLLTERLRWIHFELLAPLSGFDSDVERLNQEISDLKSELQIYEDGELQDWSLCVEDVAYQIPWPLLTEREPVLYLRPIAGASPRTHFLPPEPRVAIWYHPRTDLPHIKKEVDQILHLFPKAQVYQTAADILNNSENMDFDLIHVAAHGRYDQENPMFSSIELGDGHLLACDIARAGFTAKIATLASCESATLGQPAGWEPQGLARAFLARKCETVIGSLWPLNDCVAEFAFGHLYDSLRKGASVAEAMKNVRQKIRQEFEHPAYWGSLVMFGGYSQ